MQIVQPPPMVPEPRRIARVRRETHDTVTLTIEAADPFCFQPGQFNMLYAFAVGEVAISMSGDPAKRTDIVHTIKAVGATTAALCRLRKGAMVGVRGPYGRAWPVGDVKGRDLVFVAGGVGFAPLRPAIHHVLRHRGDYGRVCLLVGARTPDDLLFQRELARWRSRADLQVLATVDRAGAAWRGRVGVVPALLADAVFDPERAAAFLCGPEVMMRFSIRELATRGLREERIYVSLERNMKCAIGWCGHCQYGPHFVCKDGPVFSVDRIRPLLGLREV